MTVQLQNLIRPRKLAPGDRLAAVTLSWGGPGQIRERYEIGKRQLAETFGITLVEMPHTCASPQFVADHPAARASDLAMAFADPSIAGIVSTIGGDDSIRLIPHLDLDVIANNPKVFVGYSDTTVTHLACLKAGLATFYGPSVMSGFAENGGMHDYLVESVRRVLFEPAPLGQVPENTEGWTVEMLDWAVAENNDRKRALMAPEGWRFLQGRGVARGRLLGGCLEVLEWLRGTPVWPTKAQWQNAILFLETSEDGPPPDLVVAALRSYAAEGVLAGISGILFGRPGGQLDPATFSQYDDAIRSVVGREEGLVDLPVVTRMDFGHTDPMMTLPIGCLAEIDCEAGAVRLLEAGVSA